MIVFDCVKEKEVEVDDKMIVYVQRRNTDNRLPYAEDFDKIKLKEAVKGERVQTYIYAKRGGSIPDIYKIV